MALELVVTEVFTRGNERYQVGDTITDPEMQAWTVKNRPTHVTRRRRPDPAPVVAPAPADLEHAEEK